MPETMQDYLRRVHREDMPRWLETGELLLEKFFQSRTVYYPGAGTDGSPIKIFNCSHSSHCFVWVDQEYEFNEMERTGKLYLRGYNVREARQMDIVIQTNRMPFTL